MIEHVIPCTLVGPLWHLLTSLGLCSGLFADNAPGQKRRDEKKLVSLLSLWTWTGVTLEAELGWMLQDRHPGSYNVNFVFGRCVWKPWTCWNVSVDRKDPEAKREAPVEVHQAPESVESTPEEPKAGSERTWELEPIPSQILHRIIQIYVDPCCILMSCFCELRHQEIRTDSKFFLASMDAALWIHPAQLGRRKNPQLQLSQTSWVLADEELNIGNVGNGAGESRIALDTCNCCTQETMGTCVAWEKKGYSCA